jgi:hypothetical protein
VHLYLTGLVDRVGQAPGDTLGELGSGPVGECHAEDAFGLDTVMLDEVGDHHGHGGGLAGPGPGSDPNRRRAQLEYSPLL